MFEWKKTSRRIGRLRLAGSTGHSVVSCPACRVCSWPVNCARIIVYSDLLYISFNINFYFWHHKTERKMIHPIMQSWFFRFPGLWFPLTLRINIELFCWNQKLKNQINNKKDDFLFSSWNCFTEKYQIVSQERHPSRPSLLCSNHPYFSCTIT